MEFLTQFGEEAMEMSDESTSMVANAATDTGAATTVMVLGVVLGIVVVVYVLSAFFLSKALKKAGIPAWKAWVPVLGMLSLTSTNKESVSSTIQPINPISSPDQTAPAPMTGFSSPFGASETPASMPAPEAAWQPGAPDPEAETPIGPTLTSEAPSETQATSSDAPIGPTLAPLPYQPPVSSGAPTQPVQTPPVPAQTPSQPPTPPTLS